MAAVVGYLAVLGILALFTFYMDGDTGVQLLAVYLLLPAASALLTLLARQQLKIRLTLPDSVKKGGTCMLTAEITKRWRIPLPFVRFRLEPDGHFDSPMVPVQTALAFGRQDTRQAELLPRICGQAQVDAADPRVIGYFGFLKLKLEMPAPAQVMIVPQVPELTAKDALFTVMSAAVQTESEEETNTQVAFGAATTAGYEHRDYVPGDPLKRINWKLSSKRQSLMVRMDEAVSLSRVHVLLDLARPQGAPAYKSRFLLEQQITEGALGMLALCARQGMAAVFSYQSLSGWQEVLAESPEAVEELALHVLERGFSEELGAARLSGSFLSGSGSGVYLIYTANPDPELLSQAAHMRGEVHIVMPGGMDAAGAKLHFWWLQSDFRLLPMT